MCCSLSLSRLYVTSFDKDRKRDWPRSGSLAYIKSPPGEINPRPSRSFVISLQARVYIGGDMAVIAMIASNGEMYICDSL